MRISKKFLQSNQNLAIHKESEAGQGCIKGAHEVIQMTKTTEKIKGSDADSVSGHILKEGNQNLIEPM